MATRLQSNLTYQKAVHKAARDLELNPKLVDEAFIKMWKDVSEIMSTDDFAKIYLKGWGTYSPSIKGIEKHLRRFDYLLDRMPEEYIEGKKYKKEDWLAGIESRRKKTIKSLKRIAQERGIERYKNLKQKMTETKMYKLIAESARDFALQNPKTLYDNIKYHNDDILVAEVFVWNKPAESRIIGAEQFMGSINKFTFPVAFVHSSNLEGYKAGDLIGCMTLTAVR